MAKKGRVFSAEFKRAAVKRMRQGESPSELARRLKVRRKQLYEWRNAVAAGRLPGVPGRPKKDPTGERRAEDLAGRVKELEQLVGQLTAENRFFKNALQRIKDVRQRSETTGAAVSSRRSRR
jgi:transposase-like protein